MVVDPTRTALIDSVVVVGGVAWRLLPFGLTKFGFKIITYWNSALAMNE
jgi:hypothetical protein